MSIITEAVFLALIKSHCDFYRVTPKNKEKVIKCLTTIVNCSIIEDGSKIYKEQLEKCLNEHPRTP